MPRIIASRYWNSNGHAVAIVAVEGYAADWACYIGSSDFTDYENDVLADVASRGAKLAEKEARFFFPSIQLSYRA